MDGAIKIDGLRQFQRDLAKLNTDLPKALRLACNEAADVVVQYARPRIPSLTGRARASVRARSTRTAVRISGGSARVPYYPWLDFGGKVGRGRSVSRRYYSEGRYIYEGYHRTKGQLADTLTAALLDVARQAGVEVTGDGG